MLPCGVFCARANREGVGRRCVPRFCRPSVRLSGRGAPVPIVQPPLRFSCFAVASLTFFLVSVWSSSSSFVTVCVRARGREGLFRWRKEQVGR